MGFESFSVCFCLGSEDFLIVFTMFPRHDRRLGIHEKVQYSQHDEMSFTVQYTVDWCRLIGFPACFLNSLFCLFVLFFCPRMTLAMFLTVCPGGPLRGVTAFVREAVVADPWPAVPV